MMTESQNGGDCRVDRSRQRDKHVRMKEARGRGGKGGRERLKGEREMGKGGEEEGKRERGEGKA